jgi:hypothetical protein
MTLEQLLNIVACIALILFGLYALVRPYEAGQIAHIKPEDANGTAEIRINFGGLSLMMGIAPLVLNDAAAFQVVGIVFLGVFVTRLATQLVDHPQINSVFFLSGLFELLVGLILVLR